MKKYLLIIILIFISSYSFGQEIYSISVTDGIITDTLRFGLNPNATNGIDNALGENELPPPPISDILDVRFSGEDLIPLVPIGEGLNIDLREGNNMTEDTMYHKLKFQWPPLATFLRINCLNIPIGISIQLKDLFKGVLIDTVLSESDSFTITSTGIVALLFDVRYQFPRPVELTSFNSSISGNDVLLNWITSSENNNTGFEIQRKNIQNNIWNSLDFIPGQINSSQNTVYNYTDINLEAGSYNYRLKQIDLNGNFEYFNLTETVRIGSPESFYVSQNYPNPFNPVTKINYNLPTSSHLKISVFDNRGKLVKVLQDGFSASGYYEISIDASELTSGLYYCNFEYGNNTISRKIVVLK